MIEYKVGAYAMPQGTLYSVVLYKNKQFVGRALDPQENERLANDIAAELNKIVRDEHHSLSAYPWGLHLSWREIVVNWFLSREASQ